MPRKVLIIDTSILCVHLQIPGKETCGPDADKWDHDRVKQKFEDEEKAGTTFVLPMATLIECGNHVNQIKSGGCYDFAMGLAKILEKAANEKSPWAAFTDQSSLWSGEQLLKLAKEWPEHCSTIGIGDYTIKDVAELYAKAGNPVELLTGDKGLKAYEPIKPSVQPRRRQAK